VVGELLGLVAPPACVACRAPVARAEVLVCAACLRALPWLRGRRCPRCALPRHPARGCPAAGAAFAGAWAPLAYEGSARALVAALKFRGALAVAGLMGAQLAAHLPAALRGPPAPALDRDRTQRLEQPAAQPVLEPGALEVLGLGQERDLAADHEGHHEAVDHREVVDRQDHRPPAGHPVRAGHHRPEPDPGCEPHHPANHAVDHLTTVT
jgi:hypothetical protein